MKCDDYRCESTDTQFCVMCEGTFCPDHSYHYCCQCGPEDYTCMCGDSELETCVGGHDGDTCFCGDR